MASKNVAKLPSGKYRARYRDEAGKEHARHFSRKVDARRWLDEVTADVLTGMYVDPRAGKVTFRDYATKWQAAQLHRRTTAASVDTALRVHAIPQFGELRLGAIRQSDIQQWVHGLTAILSPSSVRVTYQHVRAVFRAAEADRIIGRSPCQRISLPALENPEVIPLATEVVLAIEDQMPAHLRALVRLMAGTGMRPGEATAVTLDRIDFLRRTVRVDRQLVLTRPHTFGPPKTKASYRTIPLPQVVVDSLAAHVAEYGTGIDEMLFTALDRSMLNRDYVTRSFRRAASAAHAPAGTRLHSLRHYYASLLIRHGESVKVVQARLGHSSAQETLDTYSHLWPDSEDTTRAAIDAVLGASADDLRTAVQPQERFRR
jgi:integrase